MNYIRRYRGYRSHEAYQDFCSRIYSIHLIFTLCAQFQVSLLWGNWRALSQWTLSWNFCMHNLLKLTKEPVLLDPRFPPFTFPFVGTEIQTLRDAPAMCFIRQRFVTSFYFHFHQCVTASSTLKNWQARKVFLLKLWLWDHRLLLLKQEMIV